MALTGERALSPTDWVREQTERILAAGTTAAVVDGEGPGVVLVTIRGARTGLLRYTPLVRVEHDGHYALVASKGGAPDNPAWYANLRANPHVELQDGTDTADYDAHEAVGEERTQWWERAVAAFPPYAEYQERTARQIPVFVLEPREG